MNGYVVKQSEHHGRDKNEIKSERLASKPLFGSEIQTFHGNYRDCIHAPKREIQENTRKVLESLRQQQQWTSVLPKIRKENGLQVLAAAPHTPALVAQPTHDSLRIQSD